MPLKRIPGTTAGNSLINHEICTLGQMLHRCKLWGPIKQNYTPLPVAKWSPREDKILSEEDEESFFREGALCEEAQLAYWIAAITNNTSAAGCELRGLRLKHLYLREPVIDKKTGVDMNPSEFYIPPEAVKNESRPRKIALNLTAKWAVLQLYRRALRLGSCQPEDFLLPFRIGPGRYDPKRPASRWFLRNSWNKLRAHTGMPDLCPHDLRHQFITKMVESGADRELIKSIAGHVTDEMFEYYSHVRRQAKYAAVMAIEPSARGKKPMGVVTREGRRVRRA